MMPGGHALAVMFAVLASLEAKVCHSVDIRNKPDRLEALRGCHVVEGHVSIVLMERGNETDFDRHAVPELREITEYLLFYRVVGLRSVGQIFPNLAVIRGSTLFQDYALVIYEMFNLQEVALWSLTHIMRGAIRIEKNPSLCYVHTVNWELIAPWDPDKNYVAHNKDPADCPGCGESCAGNFCWSHDHCQMEKAVNEGCNALCIGSCSDPGPRGCYTCSKYLTADNQCLDHCPTGTLHFLGRRCVTRAECISTELPLDSQSPISFKSQKNTYVTFNNSCTDHCPAGYTLDVNASNCVVCQGGKCPKSCPGSSIENIADAQALRGCTHIEGSLEISIKIGKPKIVYQELEEYLGAIEEIEGCLKITRSSPIVNLNFLKNLMVIRGMNINENYAFIVMDNPNLQELWDWNKKSNFKIVNKRLFFHYNPKLCLFHISRLIQIVQQHNVTNLEVSQESNGDKFPCNAADIKLKVVSKSSNFIQIYIPHVQDSFLRYQVHFIKNNDGTVSKYDDLDQCSDVGWRTRDVYRNMSNENIPQPGVLVNLTWLEPYVKYAYYVSVYSVDSIVGTSVLYNERTLPSKPGELSSADAQSNSSSEIVVTWQPPRLINGKLEYFVVKWMLLNKDESLRYNRNYCENPMDYVLEVYEIEQDTSYLSGNLSCCNHYNQRTVTISFEAIDSNLSSGSYISERNYLQTCRQCTYKIANINVNKTMTKTVQPNLFSNKSRSENIKYLPASARSYKISHVAHFSDYVVEVKACREKHLQDSAQEEEYNCSKSKLLIVRTKMNNNSDAIPDSIRHRIVNKTLIVSWDSPSNPNGVVLTFQFEYKCTDVSNPKTTTVCIPYNEYEINKHEHIVTDLLPGNYEFRVQAITLAGKGPFSQYIQFTIHNGLVSSETAFISLIIVFILLFFLSVVLVFKCMKRKKCELNQILVASVNPHYQMTLDKWELCKKDILVGKQLGSGTFGKVYEGLLLPNKVPCAVKTVSEDTFLQQKNIFLNEASILKSVSSAYHIVQLLGVVSSEKPHLVVMELMNLGDLRGYLRSIREQDVYHNTFKLKAASEIADGMCFLEAKKYVHRDLAARNCLVSENLTVKVADFGMTRDIYETDYYRKGGEELLPIRWMAPESLKDGLFTSQSDVWSYGVVLWEIATLGEQPYQGLSNEEVLKHVIAGQANLEIPTYCPTVLKSLMIFCWRRKANQRISFMSAITSLESYTDEHFKKVSYCHSKEANFIKRNLTEYVEMESVEDPLLHATHNSSERYRMSFIRTFAQRGLLKLSAISESSQENL